MGTCVEDSGWETCSLSCNHSTAQGTRHRSRRPRHYQSLYRTHPETCANVSSQTRQYPASTTPSAIQPSLARPGKPVSVLPARLTLQFALAGTRGWRWVAMGGDGLAMGPPVQSRTEGQPAPITSTHGRAGAGSAGTYARPSVSVLGRALVLLGGAGSLAFPGEGAVLGLSWRRFLGTIGQPWRYGGIPECNTRSASSLQDRATTSKPINVLCYR